MNQSSHPRFVVGLILLTILCTVALGLQERRSSPLAAYSPVSPLIAVPGVLQDVGELRARLFQRDFWLQPWPWIAVGVVGFGLLAWVLVWGFQRRSATR